MRESPKPYLYEYIWKEKFDGGEDSLTNRIREALKEVDSGLRCIDIGCGDGMFCSLVRDRFSQVLGVDGSRISLGGAASKGIHVCLTDLDEGSLPFKDNVFDCVSCLDVIEHVFDPEKLVIEANRVLRRGGIFILTTPNIRFIDFVKRLLLDGQFPKTSQDEGSYDGGHIHYFTFRDIRELLLRNGFRIIKERGYDEKAYFSPKVLFFKLIVRVWEKDVNREFFCPGILFKALKI
jgi:methionine biosynthesis protein MetW